MLSLSAYHILLLKLDKNWVAAAASIYCLLEIYRRPVENITGVKLHRGKYWRKVRRWWYWETGNRKKRRPRPSKEDKMLSRRNELSSLLGSYLHHMLPSLTNPTENEQKQRAREQMDFMAEREWICNYMWNVHLTITTSTDGSKTNGQKKRKISICFDSHDDDEYEKNKTTEKN